MYRLWVLKREVGDGGVAQAQAASTLEVSPGAAGEEAAVLVRRPTEPLNQTVKRHEFSLGGALLSVQLEAVLFIDAWPAPAGAVPQLQPLSPAGSSNDSHRLEPAALLAVSQALYGRAPAAQLLLVPAHGFEHGTALSAELRAALPQARALLRQWLGGHA